MRMLQRRGELDLAAEALGVHSGGEFGWEHLHDDPPAERLLLGHEHVAHPSPAELPLDAVGIAEGALETVQQIGHGPKIRRGRPPRDARTRLAGM